MHACIFVCFGASEGVLRTNWWERCKNKNKISKIDGNSLIRSLYISFLASEGQQQELNKKDDLVFIEFPLAVLYFHHCC